MHGLIALLIAATLGLTEIDVAARLDAEEHLDAAATAYVLALNAGLEAPELQRRVSTLAIALHAIYERDRMRQIDLAIDLAKADPAEVPRLQEELRQLRMERDLYLRKRVATELKQRQAIAAAERR